MKQWSKRVLAAAAVLVIPLVAVAQDLPRVQVMRKTNGATITMQSGTLTATQILTRDGFELELANDVDIVSLKANLAGRVSVARGGRMLWFSIRDLASGDWTTAAAWLAASPVVRQFDRVMSRWPPGTSGAILFRAAHSVLGTLRGDDAALRVLMASEAPRAAMRLVRDDPNGCVSAYERTFSELVSEMESCANEGNPFKTAYCAYAFNLKVTQALVEFFGCI